MDVTETTAKATLLEGPDAWASFRRELPDGSDVLAGADLAECDLSGRDLSLLDLTGVDAFRANLQDTNLKHCLLDHAEMAGANLTGADLYKARLDDAVFQEADLTGADLSMTSCKRADFRHAKLKQCNLAGARLEDADASYCLFDGADLQGADLTRARLRFASIERVNLTGIVYGNHRDMRTRYFGIVGTATAYGSGRFVRDVNDQDFIDSLYHDAEQLSPGARRRRRLLLGLWARIDYGRSLTAVAAWAIILSLIYGFVYWLDQTNDWGMIDFSGSAQTPITPFYYSIVTYTTLGFGDITAANMLGEILVISEVFIGYFTLGLLMAILANSVARRS